jgi:predicted small lipoprotein YifL
MKRNLMVMIACASVLALAACEKKGPLEQAGEEVDEAVETIKQREEPTSANIHDAMDEARKDVEEMKDEPKDEAKEGPKN